MRELADYLVDMLTMAAMVILVIKVIVKTKMIIINDDD